MEPGLLFDSAAAHYSRYRHGYGDEVVGHIASELSLGRRSRVLDLGCGPGTLAIPLSRFAGAIVAVDPSDDMLAEGARQAPTANITWLKGDSSRLTALPLGRVDHTVMGRSFHWMDRARVLADLDALLPPAGAVVLVGPARDPVEPPWEPVAQAVRQSFGLEWRAGTDCYHRSARHHVELLAESPFHDLTSASFHRTARRDAEAVIGLQLSYSYSTPARLGDRLPAFVEALGQALAEAHPSGVWEEEIATEVVVARRP
ncbi:class I SAM-dependent methyltransferase [Sphaerisporangium sp. NPDC049002]|uniref:class I SAM-dependent methyltransferase n=1 Tax=unclassified Sphaerisporangium TaxID=2630420 RepID=UPI0033F82604